MNDWGRDELMVIAAFRYCCGRQTDIVGDCVEWLIRIWPELKPETRALIQRDLEEEFARDDGVREFGIVRSFKPLGDDCDRAEWERVRALWRTE